MNNIFDFTKSDLSKLFDKKYQAAQVFNWLYKKREFNFEKYSNVSKKLKEHLKNNFFISSLEVIKKEVDKDVVKILFKLEDKSLIETVLMKHSYGNSICISTQVGCNMGCLFCESGKLKKQRDLTTAEMILQILLMEEITKTKIKSVVIMGIGEPFDNYENLVKFLKIINDKDGLDIGSRKITVSTSGIVPKIKEFAKLGLQVNLAISLHSPFDEIRSSIMPINKVYNLSQLVESLKEYQALTNRRITIEYVMLNMINDSKKDAMKLVNLLKGLNVYVNLIPYNSTSGVYKASSKETIKEFYQILKENLIDTTIRKEMGSNINAACGQLRSKNENILPN